MIAYDLDGVLCSDTKFFNPPVEYVELRRNFVYPIFKPKGKWCIITGRPKVDSTQTQSWIKEHFALNMPVHVFHDNRDIANSFEYKKQILVENPNIKIFIESDKRQYLKLKYDIDVHQEIYWFENLIKESIGNINI